MKCPGQDSRYWKPGAIFEAKCPQCQHVVEFFKDDTTRKCPKCDHRFVNPNLDFGCASYCEFAEQCIGTLPPELIAQKDDLLKDRVAIEMKRHYKTDFKRIGFIGRVARYAEKIGKAEGGNLAVILTSAYLYDIGNSTQGADKTTAGDILLKLGANENLIEKVLTLIETDPKSDQRNDLSYRIVHDARTLAILEETQKTEPIEKATLTDKIESAFLTQGGRKEAQKLLL